MHFKDKVAVVTGGSSGIGKETAKRLLAHGASVVIGGKDEAKLRSTTAELAAPDRIELVAGSIADPAAGVALVERAERRFGVLTS